MKEFIIRNDRLIGVLVDGSTMISPHEFSHSDIKSIIIPETVTYIGEYAFESCFRLEEIIIPSSVSHIKYRAFQSCKNLKSITIPYCCYFEDNLFEGCEKLKNIMFK